MLCTSRKTTQFIKLYIDNRDDNSFIIVMMMMMMIMMMMTMLMMMMVAVAAVVEVGANDDDDTGSKIGLCIKVGRGQGDGDIGTWMMMMMMMWMIIAKVGGKCDISFFMKMCYLWFHLPKPHWIPYDVCTKYFFIIGVSKMTIVIRV